MSLGDYTNKVCKTPLLQLRDIRRIQDRVPKSVFIVTSNALVISKVDNCKSLYNGPDEYSEQNLQTIHNYIA